MRITRLLAAGLLVLALAGSGAIAWEEDDFHRKPAAMYTVAAGESVIGELQWYRVREGDTLFDIARQHSLGYNEIVDRNPALDVWLPPPGAVVLLPTEWVLPCCARRGIVINIPEMRLYYYRPAEADPELTEVMTYAVGLGREDWQTPRGKFTVRAKTENPTWVIPESIRKEHIEDRGDDRKAIAGGAEDNPLGKHRIALSLPSYAIHGTNIPWGVGMQVSHGCIRLYPEDIARLFPEVPVGTPGAFVYQPVKVGVRNGDVYVEVARDIYGLMPALWREASDMLAQLGVTDRVDQERLIEVLRQPIGIPVKVSGTPDSSRQLVAMDALRKWTHARISRSDEIEASDD